ncbi:MAG: YggT family protein [Actinobacteria bacterium]|nr:YggT family protein [Actinomycetota bacterium]
MTFLTQVAITLARIVLSFYGFWLVWRVMLPWLPGPDAVRERIAPYACFFTDPVIEPLRRLTGMPARAWAGLLLVAVAAALVALPG